MTSHVLALAYFLHACAALAWSHAVPRRVPLNIESGPICGVEREAEDNTTYASFRGVPYAKQPLGELRFQELQPLEPWTEPLDASSEGPICLQTDVIYARMMQPQGMSEACIYANIHVPMEALPLNGRFSSSEARDRKSPGLPILVFIHGGGFAYGSGDSDVYGPEYLVSKKVIVVTFNYRLNVFGFLAMNTTKIPGNAGLRDQVTLLRWVQRNAKYFGGDPNNVTLAGQSAGSVSAHYLALSKATTGLFRNVILMSGTATTTFSSSSPLLAQRMAKQLLATLQINSTDPDDIHRQLIELPAEKLVEANMKILEQVGLTTFVPVVESPLPGVTTIIDEDPDDLVAKGRGKHIPLLLGYTSDECETFRSRLDKFGIAQKLKKNFFIKVPPKFLFTTPPHLILDITKKIDTKYYEGVMPLDGFVKECSEGFFEYPALNLAKKRAETGSSPVYLYRFAYEGQSNVIKEGTGVDYEGVGHIEDLTYVFKANAVLSAPETTQPTPEDLYMKDLMTNFFVNFMSCSKPICGVKHSLWPADNGHQFEDIQSPTNIQTKELTPRQQDVLDFFESLTSKK